MLEHTDEPKFLVFRWVLRCPDITYPFQLHTVWSSLGFGVVLTPKDDNHCEYVIVLASKRKNKVESNYSSYGGEALAAVWIIVCSATPRLENGSGGQMNSNFILVGVHWVWERFWPRKTIMTTNMLLPLLLEAITKLSPIIRLMKERHWPQFGSTYAQPLPVEDGAGGQKMMHLVIQRSTQGDKTNTDLPCGPESKWSTYPHPLLW